MRRIFLCSRTGRVNMKIRFGMKNDMGRSAPNALRMEHRRQDGRCDRRLGRSDPMSFKRMMIKKRYGVFQDDFNDYSVHIYSVANP